MALSWSGRRELTLLLPSLNVIVGLVTLGLCVCRLGYMHSNEYAPPIDFVYTWVNGSDPVLMEKLVKYAEASEGGVKANANKARFRELDELRYSLRSVERYAPWVRHIFILVDDDQVPDWLDTSNPKVTVVKHSEVLVEESENQLPNFNSHALELVLHRIPGISKNFVYLNNDFILGSPVWPSDYFTPPYFTKGKFHLSGGDSFLPADAPKKFMTYLSQNVTNALLTKRFGNRSRSRIAHAPYPFIRSAVRDVWILWPKEAFKTTKARFRKPDDLNPILAASWVAMETSRGVGRWSHFSTDMYFDVDGSMASFNSQKHFVRTFRPHSICFNDNAAYKDADPGYYEAVHALFEELQPYPSSFELPRGRGRG